MRSLLDDTGAWTTFAALSYSLAVSVGIFVFWSYMLRLLPAMRTAASRIGLLLSMALGSVAIVAMSSWLNAAAQRSLLVAMPVLLTLARSTLAMDPDLSERLVGPRPWIGCTLRGSGWQRAAAARVSDDEYG